MFEWSEDGREEVFISMSPLVQQHFFSGIIAAGVTETHSLFIFTDSAGPARANDASRGVQFLNKPRTIFGVISPIVQGLFSKLNRLNQQMFDANGNLNSLFWHIHIESRDKRDG